MFKKTVSPVLFSSVLCLLCIVCAVPAHAAKGGGGPKDRVAPTVTIDSPADGVTVTEPSLAVSGSATDNVGVVSAEITVNTAAPVPLALGSGGEFTTQATLSPGSNTIEVRARDAAGKEGSSSRQVTFNRQSSQVTILSPADGDVIHAAHVDVRGTYENPVEGLVPFYPHTAANGNFYITGYPLRPGQNTITVVGYDSEKNYHETSITVECTSEEDPLVLSTDRPGGEAPLEVVFSLANNTGETIASCEIDYEDDGSYVPAPGGVDGLTRTYAEGGLHQPSVRVTTSQGHHFTGYHVLSAHGPAQFLLSFPVEDPVDLAVDGEGRVYVMDRVFNSVRVFDADGTAIAGFGGLTSQPSGLAVDRDGNVYVSDTGHDRVQIYSPSFVPSGSWGYAGARLGEMSAPRGIAVDYDGEIVLADTGNSRVDRYRNNGTFKNVIGAGDLVDPRDVVWTGGGDLAVADYGAGEVRLFSAEGSAIEWQREPPPLGKPAGLSYDHKGGYLTVADEERNRVTMLRMERDHAVFVRHIENIVGDPKSLSRPMAAVRVVTPVEEVCYIADNGNQRVVKVSLSAGPGDDPAAVWSNLKEALAAGEVEEAVAHFAPRTQELYRDALTEIVDQLPVVADDMGELLPLKVGATEAEFGVLRVDGEKPFLFNVKFVKDGMGPWKILHW